MIRVYGGEYTHAIDHLLKSQRRAETSRNEKIAQKQLLKNDTFAEA